MQFENRQVAEGVNVTKVHPLKQFMQLLIATVILVVVLVILMQVLGAWAAKRIPFSFEVQVMSKVDVELGNAPPDSEIRQYLNSLAAKLEISCSIADCSTSFRMKMP